MALVVARAPRCRPSRGSGAESAGLRRSPGRPRGWFLTALLDLAVPQHDHAVGRRATDTVRAQSALGSDGRWHIFAQGECEPRGRAVGESSQRARRGGNGPPSTQRCQPSARLGLGSTSLAPSTVQSDLQVIVKLPCFERRKTLWSLSRRSSLRRFRYRCFCGGVGRNCCD